MARSREVFSWPLGERGSPPGPLGCGTKRPSGSPAFGWASFVGPQSWQSHLSTARTSGLVLGAGGAQPHSHPRRRPVCVLLALRLGGGWGHLQELSVREDFRDASGLVPFGVCPVRQVGLSSREVLQAHGLMACVPRDHPGSEELPQGRGRSLAGADPGASIRGFHHGPALACLPCVPFKPHFLGISGGGTSKGSQTEDLTGLGHVLASQALACSPGTCGGPCLPGRPREGRGSFCTSPFQS